MKILKRFYLKIDSWMFDDYKDDGKFKTFAKAIFQVWLFLYAPAKYFHMIGTHYCGNTGSWIGLILGILFSFYLICIKLGRMKY